MDGGNRRELRCGGGILPGGGGLDRGAGGGKKTAVKRRRGSGNYTNGLPRAWATPWPTRRLAW